MADVSLIEPLAVTPVPQIQIALIIIHVRMIAVLEDFVNLLLELTAIIVVPTPNAMIITPAQLILVHQMCVPTLINLIVNLAQMPLSAKTIIHVRMIAV
jgi:hypothetical protein